LNASWSCDRSVLLPGVRAYALVLYWPSLNLASINYKLRLVENLVGLAGFVSQLTKTQDFTLKGQKSPVA
jgi:hypothetical protein